MYYCWGGWCYVSSAHFFFFVVVLLYEVTIRSTQWVNIVFISIFRTQWSWLSKDVIFSYTNGHNQECFMSKTWSFLTECNRSCLAPELNDTNTVWRSLRFVILCLKYWSLKYSFEFETFTPECWQKVKTWKIFVIYIF